MILSKNDLRFYIAADRIMNGYPAKKTIKEVVINLIDKPVRGVIIKYLRALRTYAYYRNTIKKRFSLRVLPMVWWHRRWNQLGLQLGYSIGPNSIGYGAVIPHNGTIIINSEAHIGNFAVLHTSTCVAGGDKEIGDFFYLSTGSQIVGKLCLGNGTTVAAHSLVNKSSEGSCLLAGSPATIKRIEYPLWFGTEDGPYKKRVDMVNELKKKLINE